MVPIKRVGIKKVKPKVFNKKKVCDHADLCLIYGIINIYLAKTPYFIPT